MQQVGKCWFFGKLDAADQSAEEIAALLEQGEAFPLDGWVVVRADNSANIYAIPEPLFDKCVEHMRRFRTTVRGKSMLLEETAFHENVVEASSGTFTCYTFGNFFGSNALLLESDELPANIRTECVGKKMANVHLAFPQSGGVTIVKWSPRA